MSSGLLEMFVPGLGYAISGQWDKAAIIGGGKWIASNHLYNSYNSKDIQLNTDEIYQFTDTDQSKSGLAETKVYLNKETWKAQFYSNVYSNLLLTTWGDMYQHGCKSNIETYGYMLAPLRVDHFYDKWSFWIPIAFAGYLYNELPKYSKIEYHLGNGLKRDELKRESFMMYYGVGLGEEMFFRGTVQDAIFYLYKDSFGFSGEFSRHLSVFSASAVFGAAHNGSGFTANPATAFVFGLYLGYVYHPSLAEFDLTTAIAIHSWWDIIVSFAVLNNAEYFEGDQAVSVPLLNIAFQF